MKYRIVDSKIEFNTGYSDCNTSAGDWNGTFKVRPERGPFLYFFYSTADGGFHGVTHDDLLSGAYHSGNPPMWIELYTADQSLSLHKSKYAPIFRSLEKFIATIPASITLKD